ncbi:MAG TPA: mechanosensitive ion channel domain-containing protein [Stellaceae bacterium]|nr:mechanosensitive ion channel domain-containing protein [Stellaceae bacterium]
MNLRRVVALLALVTCLLAAFGLAAQAQTAPPPPASAAGPPLSPGDVDALQHLVDTLQNDQQRAQLVAQLQALLAAERESQQQAPPAAPAPTDWLSTLSQQVDAISAEIVDAAGAVDFAQLFRYLEEQAGDRHLRAKWLGISLKLVIVFGAAVIGDWTLRVLLRPLQRRLAARTSDGTLPQLLLLLLLLLIISLPIIGFAAIAYTALPLVNARTTSTNLAEVVIAAIVTARLILASAHVVLLSPGAVTLYPVGEETRNYLYLWVRRFTAWAVYGYAAASLAYWAGAPGAVFVLLLRFTMLMLGVLSVVFVMQNRAAVAEMLRGKPGQAANGAQAEGWRILRQRLADTWHVLAIVYLGGIFGNYVLRIDAGFTLVFRITLVSLVILLAAALVVRAIRRLSQRGFAVGPDLKRRFPTLETRANRYLPALTTAAAVLVYAVAALALLEAWGVNAFAWFDSTFGRRLASGLVSILTVVLGALVLWELFGSAIERYLSKLGGDGQPLARSARVRTLVPLLRTTVLIVLITVVTLIVLSELGVNIAPLLAGAGVAGIAIGLGSQALIKDLINGLFILLDNTLALGEVVDVGNNHAGVVEAISIRAIKLRDNAGTVHTVPFSEVSAVKNLTRDFSYFVAEVGVSLREDPDRIVAVLRQVADEMRQEPDWERSILAALEVVGVDRFTDNAMFIQARMRTIPSRQWAVGREFNRRMKKAFDEQGIELALTAQVRYLEAPPMPTPAPAKA